MAGCGLPRQALSHDGRPLVVDEVSHCHVVAYRARPARLRNNGFWWLDEIRKRGIGLQLTDFLPALGFSDALPRRCGCTTGEACRCR